MNMDMDIWVFGLLISIGAGRDGTGRSDYVSAHAAPVLAHIHTHANHDLSGLQA
jgi:hypothetical protein